MNVDRSARIIRRILWTFVAIVGLPLLGVILFAGFQDAPKLARFFGGMPAGCWSLLVGPPLFWASLVAMYFRASREARSLNMGQLAGRTNLGSFLMFFRRYKEQRGLDILVWTMLLSGSWCVVILWLAGWDYSRREGGFLFWLILMSVLWLAFAVWLTIFAVVTTDKK